MNGFSTALDLSVSIARSSTDSGVFLVGLFVLMSIFLVSGVAKLRHPTQAAMSIVDFGLLPQVRREAGLALGIAEVLLGIALGGIAFFPWLRWLVLPLAVMVLGVFLALIIVHLLRGAEFACFCFGNSDDTLSIGTALRTGLLGAMAVALWGMSFSVRTEWAAMDVPIALLSAVALLGIAAMLTSVPALWRWNREILPQGR